MCGKVWRVSWGACSLGDVVTQKKQGGFPIVSQIVEEECRT
jgi:hypothetical protein